MALEDDIQQASFEHEYQKLAINLSYTQLHFDNLFSQVLKAFNSTPEQYNVMRILKGKHPKPMSVKDIQGRMLNKMSNTSRLVDKLLDKGYVSRIRCKQDRRAVDIQLSEEGLAFLKAVSQEVDGLYGPYHNLSIDEARRMVKVAGAQLELTPREFDLLLFFARSPGQVFRRAQLLDQCRNFSLRLCLCCFVPHTTTSQGVGSEISS